MTKNRQIKSTPRRVTAVALGLCAGSLAPMGAVAQDAKPAEEKKPLWETVANVGVTLTRGNSDNFLGTGGINTSRKWTKDEALLGLNGGYGESQKNVPAQSGEEKVKTDEYLKGFAQWNHLLSQRTYVGLRLDGLYDNVAAINYRVGISPLAGYYFIKNERTFLVGELGPGFVVEELEDDNEGMDSYATIRVAERFEHKFSDRTKIWQSAEWVPQIDNFNNWVLTFEIGISSALTKRLDLQLKLIDTYDREPAEVDRPNLAGPNDAARKENDLKLIAGLAYKF